MEICLDILPIYTYYYIIIIINKHLLLCLLNHYQLQLRKKGADGLLFSVQKLVHLDKNEQMNSSKIVFSQTLIHRQFSSVIISFPRLEYIIRQ